jgi:hypothetical protein
LQGLAAEALGEAQQPGLAADGGDDLDDSDSDDDSYDEEGEDKDDVS